LASAGELLVVGRITGAYGIRGWVKIQSFTEPQDNLLGYGQWTLRRRGADEPIEIDEGRLQGKSLVAHIVGVDDRTLAESLRGLEIRVPAANLPTLEPGDYYWRQLQGLQVWCRDAGQPGNEDRVLLGVVDHLLETGANDVLVVRPSADSIDERERLIPYLPGEVVTQVDLDTARMEVDWYPEA
jgi:16S rRNA processing protein RimM